LNSGKLIVAARWNNICIWFKI